jgi:hypothetical protein
MTGLYGSPPCALTGPALRTLAVIRMTNVMLHTRFDMAGTPYETNSLSLSFQLPAAVVNARG